MAKFLNAEGLAHLVALIKQALPSKTSELTNDSGYVTGSKMYIGTCSTEAATNPKVCTVETFPLNDEEPLDGTIIGVKYSASDTSTSTTPTINVNGTGAKRIYYNNALLSTAKSTLQHGYANRYIYYFYDSSLDNGNGAWVWLGAGIDNNTTYSNVSLGQGYASCTTAAETVAKVASLSSYSLTANGIVSVKFSNDVPANATLNINSKGAKAIYHRDAPITAGIIKAGDTATFIYNTYYRLISIDRDDSADLSNYYNKTEVDTALDGKLDHIELYPLYEYLDGQGAVSEATAVVWNAEMQTLWNKATTQSGKMRTFQGYPAFPEDTGDNTYAWDIYGIFGAAVYIVAKVGYLIDNNGITKYYIASQEWKILQEHLTFDSTPTSNSNNPVKSSGIKTALDGKQDLLVSGTNIKTIQGNSLLGSGNIELTASNIEVQNGDTVQDSIDSLTNAKQDRLVSGTNIKTVNNNSLLGSGDIHFDGSNLVYSGDEIQELVAGETIDENLDRLDVLVYGKQDALVSGTNIKTVNNNSLLGEGNVQVGDITGEELETEIEELESTLLTDALRKSEQILLPSEKTQVLTNLGIADVAKESNLKTVNGASIVGTGNIEVLSVNAGDIDVMQAPGTSTTGVMSQKAVTEYGRRVTAEDLAGTSDWIKARLTEEGWALGKRLVYNSLYDAPARCVTPFISYDFRASEVITFHYAHEAETIETKSMVILYSSDEATRGNQFETPAEEMDIIVRGSDKVKFKFTLDIAKISECYVYNKTRGEYVWKGDEYLANLIAQYDSNLTYKGYHDGILAQDFGGSTLKTMSQKAITNAFEEDIYVNRPTYLCGRLTYFALSDYPDLDPRTADGISIVFTRNVSTAILTPFFDIWNPLNGTNNGFANQYFGLWFGSQGVNFGRLKAYGTLDTGGYRNNLYIIGHYVLTYNFKNGECKCYKNGILSSTQTTENWDEETIINDYFATCTHINLCFPEFSSGYKSAGVAVFGNVLTDDDVASIYGAGNSSIKSVVVPEEWKANYLHPLTPTSWGVACATNYGTATATSGGYTVTPPSNGTAVWFGFNGITENVRNNLIYEWDFEITSGSSTHDQTVLYSRKMRVGNSCYNCFVIYDSNGNDVTFSTLGTGSYHVVSKPNNISVHDVNVGNVWLHYYLVCTYDFSMTITNLKIMERGAALECSINNYRGHYWLQNNGTKLPLHNTYIYHAEDFLLGTDTYIEDTVIYNSSKPPQFNGQMAVDTTNGKVYVGYLTGTGGTWKQINNS